MIKTLWNQINYDAFETYTQAVYKISATERKNKLALIVTEFYRIYLYGIFGLLELDSRTFKKVFSYLHLINAGVYTIFIPDLLVAGVIRVRHRLDSSESINLSELRDNSYEENKCYFHNITHDFQLEADPQKKYWFNFITIALNLLDDNILNGLLSYFRIAPLENAATKKAFEIFEKAVYYWIFWIHDDSLDDPLQTATGLQDIGLIGRLEIFSTPDLFLFLQYTTPEEFNKSYQYFISNSRFSSVLNCWVELVCLINPSLTDIQEVNNMKFQNTFLNLCYLSAYFFDPANKLPHDNDVKKFTIIKGYISHLGEEYSKFTTLIKDKLNTKL